MTLTFTLEPEPNSVLVTVPVPAGAYDRLQLRRQGPSGVTATVRGAAALVVSPSTTVYVRDFEPPLGVPLKYTADVFAFANPSAVLTQTGTVTVPGGGCDNTWLTDLVRATNTQKVVVESLDELAYEIPAGVHRILGRRAPIVTSGVAWTPSFELLFLTDTEDARERARATLGNGIPVLLRTPPENGIGNLYLSVVGWSEQRIVKAATVQDRRFVVNAVQVDRPDPDIFEPAPPVVYSHVKATYATYTAVKAAYATYDGLLWDYTGVEAADVVPWPPSDV